MEGLHESSREASQFVCIYTDSTELNKIASICNNDTKTWGRNTLYQILGVRPKLTQRDVLIFTILTTIPLLNELAGCIPSWGLDQEFQNSRQTNCHQT